MKVGLLTYHNAVNYGAVLQAFALQESLGDICDADVAVIDYRSPAVERQYRFVEYKECASIKQFVLSNTTALRRRKKVKAFSDFVRQRIHHTDQVECVSDKVLEGVDTIIVGSDQVWNPACTDGDRNYLLCDVDAKKTKISYAASMGSGNKITDYAEKYGIDYCKYLEGFKAISCREEAAADFLTQKLSKDCETVADPVLLYGKEKWEELIASAPEIKTEKYVFVYNLGNFTTLLQLVKRLQRETKYRVIVVNKDAKGDWLYLGFENRSNVDPVEFLHLLSHAEIVLSDSFHATAFSILFEKRFYTVGNPHADNTNTRMRSILSHYGLERRYVVTDADRLNLNEEIDFSVAEAMIEKDRQMAKQWLKKAVCDQ